MSYTLYGSHTSPFVRRLRLLLSGKDYELVAMNLQDPADQKTLLEISPIRKIPILKDGDVTVFDSRIIANYLFPKVGHTPLSIDQENTLTLIDGIADSLVNVLLLKRSGLDDPRNSFIKNQNFRIKTGLQTLNEQIVKEDFSLNRYPALSLASLIAWINFRQLISLDKFSNLNEFVEKAAGTIPGWKETEYQDK
ncbi:MAG: glutathione S-transferase family protein [Pseudomonadota bacterium]